ncbi:MAG TPA: glycosyltransferase [Solirubrobacterales bacterium]|nr:glycosyltransferase [Solirubrobacterales bacterium]
MRLEYAISEMGVGGAERVVVDLALDAVARGDEMLLLGAPGRNDEHLAGTAVRRVSLPTGRTPLEVSRAIGRTARATRGFAPALIHAHNVRVTAVARFGSRLAGRRRAPLLTTYHGVPHEEVDAAARILRLADLVACVSTDLMEQLAARGLPPERLAVVPNGVPEPEPTSAATMRALDAELGLDADAPVVSVVGRLVAQKAHDRFLRAAAIVHRAVPAARFLVVGDGELRAPTEALAARLGLADAVVFTGIRGDATTIIARSDLLVFSSDWEGLSIAALEALARGVPVVSTAVEGTRELLGEGAGVVVPHEEEALAAAIVECLGDPARRAELGATGRRIHRERFSTARMAAAYRTLYERLLAG